MREQEGDVQTRFWSKVRIGDGCWEFRSAPSQRYGMVWLAGRNVVASRVSWMLERGPIPDRMFVCHRCDNPRCVRPSHLFLGTPRDNTRDMLAKGRHTPARGAASGRRTKPASYPVGTAVKVSKLDPERIRLIRARLLSGGTLRAIAAEFGVSAAAIQKIKAGQCWRWV
jgi:hypothetical protein